MQCSPEVAGIQNIKFYVQSIRDVTDAQQWATEGTFDYFALKKDW